MPGSLGLVVEIPQVLVPRMFNVLVLRSIPFDKPPLIETLASADSKLHYASALALGKIGYSWELAKHLKPKQPNKEVLKAIGELAEKGAVFVNILTSLPTADAIPVLQNLGRNAVHQLVSIMKGRPKHQNGKRDHDGNTSCKRSSFARTHAEVRVRRVSLSGGVTGILPGRLGAVSPPPE